MKNFYSLLLALFCLAFYHCASQIEPNNHEVTAERVWPKQAKINGVSFVSPPKSFDSELLRLPKEKVAANWICLMPFGFVREAGTEVFYNSQRQWWGERADGIRFMAEEAKRMGYQIMLKPQVWKSHGSFTGHHSYTDPADWLAFEKSYEAFILSNARLADSLSIPLFCIGTEWGQFVQERPKYWINLIVKVRAIYGGKITYAANWDEFDHCPFWEKLDYIGVDAYFPLLVDKTPAISALRNSWQPFKSRMLTLADSTYKPILFTEFGYRSRNGTAHKPWESDRGGEINLAGQANAYEALFQEFWKQGEFAGGFLWKWFPNYEEVGGPTHAGFTPQRKPVEATIKKHYRLESSD